MRELAVAVEGDPERAVGGGGGAARPGPRTHVQLGDLPRLRIDDPHIVGVHAAHPDVAALVEREAVGATGHAVFGDRSARTVETPDRAGLVRKPDCAGVVDDQSVRTASGRRLVLDDFPACRIELADGAVAVARVPDLAVLVDEQSVRMRAGRKIPFVEPLRPRIETRDAVALHHRDVDIAVGAGGGIASEFGGRHRPLGNLSGELLRSRGDAVVRTTGERGGYKWEQDDCKSSAASHRNLRWKANRGRWATRGILSIIPGRRTATGRLTPPRYGRRSRRRSSAGERDRIEEGAGLRTRVACRGAGRRCARPPPCRVRGCRRPEAR